MHTDRRARLLLSCYPRAWRERYGDEFAALLADDLAERPRSVWRDLDVIRAGVRARMTAYGLASGPVRDSRTRSAVLAWTAAVFVAAMLSIWTQLADGWLTARPDDSAARIGLVTLSVWLVALLVAAVGFGLRAALGAVNAVRRGERADVIRPMSVLVGSAGVLAAGARLMSPLWPVAHGSRHQGLLATAARVGWTATDSISTYWLHPHRLLELPAVELAWMVACPVAVAAAGWAALRLFRLSGRRGAAPSMWLSRLTGLGLMAGFAAAATWVVGSQHAASATFRAGTLDLALIGVMATAALVARNALVPSART